MVPHFEIYEQQGVDDYMWRWRFIAGNGENTANGSESYADEGKVRRAVNRHCELVLIVLGLTDLAEGLAGKVPIVVVDG